MKPRRLAGVGGVAAPVATTPPPPVAAAPAPTPPPAPARPAPTPVVATPVAPTTALALLGDHLLALCGPPPSGPIEPDDLTRNAGGLAYLMFKHEKSSPTALAAIAAQLGNLPDTTPLVCSGGTWVNVSNAPFTFWPHADGKTALEQRWTIRDNKRRLMSVRESDPGRGSDYREEVLALTVFLTAEYGPVVALATFEKACAAAGLDHYDAIVAASTPDWARTGSNGPIAANVPYPHLRVLSTLQVSQRSSRPDGRGGGGFSYAAARATAKTVTIEQLAALMPYLVPTRGQEELAEEFAAEIATYQEGFEQRCEEYAAKLAKD